MDKSNINQPDWEKVLDALEQESQLAPRLNTKEQELLQEVIFIRSAAKDFLNEPIESEAELKILIDMLKLNKEQEFSKINSIWSRVIAAAAVIIILGIALFHFNLKTKDNQLLFIQSASEIAPGKQGATLTLANGKKIKLAEVQNGKLAEESGVIVTKSESGQLIYEIKDLTGEFNEYNTLTTAKGETYKICLPDGSLVWMNAASSLTFSTSLIEHNVRRVKLEGEAYFKVSKDKKHPFIVESKEQQVVVLGTHFNVNAYGDEQVTKTTLLEGSVMIRQKNTEKILSPGFEAVNTGSGITVNKVDAELAVAWKNNNFVFANERIETVMKMVERWYNVEVVYQGTMPEDRFRGTVSRFDNISEVLNILESTGLLHFEIKDRKIYVSGNT